LPVLGGIGIGPILFLVIMPNTGQTTVCGAIWPPMRPDTPQFYACIKATPVMQIASLQIVGDTGEAIHKHQGWGCG